MSHRLCRTHVPPNKICSSVKPPTLGVSSVSPESKNLENTLTDLHAVKAIGTRRSRLYLVIYLTTFIHVLCWHLETNDSSWRAFTFDFVVHHSFPEKRICDSFTSKERRFEAELRSDKGMQF
ncbi:hypothetical protein OG21DRAFT_1195320 [Imleria badia]|nr:hypothetical protein OG21DRAFT_1195320 [Imleria badia]